MKQLSAHCLGAGELPAGSELVPTPGYDRTRLSVGIVHFGVGGFHRAHQAMYLDRLMNAGEAFEMTASSIAGKSTYAGILRLVTAAQTAKAPFVRLADRYALVFLPFTVAVAGVAWLISGDLLRSLAVLVAATPCPLILAAPVAFIAGVAQSARRGILVKGGGPLEALARAHTVLFDKTGTLTIGGARLLSIEIAPGTLRRWML